MTQQQNKKRIKLFILTGIAALVLIGAPLVWRAFEQSQAEPDPFLTTDLVEQESAAAVSPEAPQTTTEDQIDGSAESTLDPDSVSTIDIEPMGITISYVRGIPGFEFVVKRTTTGTQYVQFLSPDLAGETCTDDEGAFAAIIKNPTSDEDRTTVTDSVTVEGDEYGLSLDSDNCTSNQELFAEYQDSFSEAFSLLRLIPADLDS